MEERNPLRPQWSYFAEFLSQEGSNALGLHDLNIVAPAVPACSSVLELFQDNLLVLLPLRIVHPHPVVGDPLGALCKRMSSLLHHLVGPTVVDASNVLLDIPNVVKDVDGASQPMNFPLRLQVRLFQIIWLRFADAEVLQRLSSAAADFAQSRQVPSTFCSSH